MTPTTIKQLRARAISHSLFTLTSLTDAIAQLKFVQADPIRSPARAQDLILRQRVINYRAGDLEREYPRLDLEEDFLYAYGFLTRDAWQLLHPREAGDLSRLELEILETVKSFEEVHPQDLEKHFGRERVVNAWGGYSKATTRALEKLHHCGLLRIARRAGGIRVYEASTSTISSLPFSPLERLQKLILVIANIFAPVTEKCLSEAIALMRRRSLSSAVSIKEAIAELLNSGEMEKQKVEGINYFYPSGSLIDEEIPQQVRLLAPFDPLVWDRRRFEHFWGWPYRFEAYTPAAKRIRGYYALPMLWGAEMIGWANISAQNGKMSFDPGYIEKRPRDANFSFELKKEIGRMKTFLALKN